MPPVYVARTRRSRSRSRSTRLRSCGCCKGWVQHLRDNGFQVETMDMPDLSARQAEIRRQAGASGVSHSGRERLRGRRPRAGGRHHEAPQGAPGRCRSRRPGNAQRVARHGGWGQSNGMTCSPSTAPVARRSTHTSSKAAVLCALSTSVVAHQSRTPDNTVGPTDSRGDPCAALCDYLYIYRA